LVGVSVAIGVLASVVVGMDADNVDNVDKMVAVTDAAGAVVAV
jgi:hypothetical protein